MTTSQDELFKKAFGAINKALNSNLSEKSLKQLLFVLAIHISKIKKENGNQIKRVGEIEYSHKEEIDSNINHTKVIEYLSNILEDADSYKNKYIMLSEPFNDLAKSLESIFCDDVFNYKFGFQDTLPKIIDQFASYDKLNLAQMCTPSSVGILVAKIADPRIGDSIYDPACGSGSFLVSLKRHLCGNDDVHYDDRISLTGSDINQNALVIAKLNLYIQGCGDAHIRHCNSLIDTTYDSPFDIIVSNPPFSMKLSQSDLENLTQRFKIPGRVAKINSDYFFILHTLDNLKESGKAAIIVPTGVLFRGGQEKNIREDIVQRGVIDSVISLPPRLFPHTNIQTHILVLDKSRFKQEILMIDFGKVNTNKKQNELDAHSIDEIHRIFKDRLQVVGTSRLVTIDEIKNSNFDLQPYNYIDMVQSEIQRDSDLMDLSSLQRKQEFLFNELDKLRTQMISSLKTLDY